MKPGSILKQADLPRIVLVTALALILTNGFPVLSQEDPQTPDESQPFRIDVNLVTLRFIVTDATGRLNNSLSREDLIVEENGVPVDFDLFEQPRNQSGQSPNLWLAFLIDVSGSTFATRTEEIVAAQTFLDNLSQATRIGVFGFTSELLPFQTFTSDRQLVLESIQQARKHLGQTAIYGSLDRLMDLISSSAPDSSQKAVILISDGLDTSYDRVGATVSRARKEGFAIYTIRVPSSAQVYIGPDPSQEDPSRRTSRLHKNQEQIEAFSRLGPGTDGMSFSGFETILDFDHTLAEINDHLFGNLYRIGYYSEHGRGEDVLERIHVRPRRSDLRVASAFKKLPRQFDAKRALLQVFFDTSGKSTLNSLPQVRFREIGADMDVLRQTPEGTLIGLPFRLKVNPISFRGALSQGVQEQLGVLGLLLDPTGREIVRLREIIRVSMHAREVRAGRGIIYSNRLVAPPGTYTLKVALLELSSWRLSSFSRTVTIN